MLTLEERLIDRLILGPGHPELGSCWTWTGAISRSRSGNLYGRIMVAGQNQQVSRVAYELWVGPIPEGHEPDHLCFNTLCFNWAHLEAVTGQVNNARGNSPSAVNARKTRCIRGHNDWRVRPDGHRECRTCRREADRTKKRRKANA